MKWFYRTLHALRIISKETCCDKLTEIDIARIAKKTKEDDYIPNSFESDISISTVGAIGGPFDARLVSNRGGRIMVNPDDDLSIRTHESHNWQPITRIQKGDDGLKFVYKLAEGDKDAQDLVMSIKKEQIEEQTKKK